MDPERPVQNIDMNLCRAMESLFEGSDVLDLGASVGFYGKCLMHIREPIYNNSRGADDRFNQSVTYLVMFPIEGRESLCPIKSNLDQN